MSTAEISVNRIGDASQDGKTVADSAAATTRSSENVFHSWQAGQRPGIDGYLGDASGQERDELLRWLIPLDVTYRRRHGETPQTTDYHPRYLERDETWLADAIAAVQAGADPGVPLDNGTTTVFVPDLLGHCVGDYELESEIARGARPIPPFASAFPHRRAAFSATRLTLSSPGATIAVAPHRQKGHPC